MYVTYNERFEKFKNASGIKCDVPKAFVGFFIVIRYFGVTKLKNKSSSIDDIAYLKELIKEEKDEIYDVLNYLAFDKILDSIPNDSLNNIYLFMNRHIKSSEIMKDFIESNSFYLLLSQTLNEEDFEKIWTKRDIYEKKLRIFPIYRTDALLVTLDTSRKVLARNLIQFYLGTTVKRIYIISYNNIVFSKDDYNGIVTALTKSNKNELMEKLMYIDNPLKHFEFLESIIDGVEKDSFVLLVGIEKLVTLISDNAVSKTFFQNAEINLHTPYSANWHEFVGRLDNLYSKCSSFNTNITSIFTLEDAHNPVNSICEASKKLDSFDIISIACNEDPIIVQTFDLLDSYSKGELDEGKFINTLNTNKNKLGSDNYFLILAVKSLMDNDYIVAEKYLRNLTSNVHPANMLIIANLYINIKEYEKAYEILVKIYDADKYLNGLMAAILETVINLGENDLVEEWLNRAFRINNLDAETIQYAANYYTRNGRYSESAEKWEQLYNLTENIGYNLLCEINKILERVNEYQVSQIEQILECYAQKYPEIENEVYYRIGLILMEHKKDYNKSLEYFLKIDTNMASSYAYDAAVARLKIYKDKILKVNVTDKKISDEYLKIFARELIKDVGVLTYKNQSNNIWSKYIEDTFHYEEWKRIILKILVEKIYQWSKIEKSLFDETKISLELVDDELDKNVLEVNGENFLHFETQDKNILVRFFYAIDSVSAGEFQKANDIIFTLFKLAYYSRDDVKGLSIILGLTAWSNSNYKMGEEVESMIAIIAAIDIAIQNKEVIYPFMFGFKNIIDFLYNHTFMLSLDEGHQDALHELVNNSGNELLESKYYFIIGKYDYIIENRLELFKQNELIWSKRPELEIVFNLRDNEEEFFANELKVLIDAYYKKGLVEEACFYIDKYKTSLVINLFERIDVSYRLFYEWARILLENSNYHLSQEFILLSIGNIEKLRTVFHKRERAFIGKQANKIYRTYLEILSKQHINNQNNVGNSLSDSLLIRDVLINMVPRAIIEQKLFNRDSLLSDELVKINRRYYDLFFIINNMQQNGNMDENYKKHLSEFMKCKKYLEENHPFFRSLPLYDKLNKDLSGDKYSAIRMKLQDDELFYQVVLVDNLLLYNIITKDNNEIDVEMIDLDIYKEMFETFKKNIILDDFYLCKRECNDNFIKLCDDFSLIFAKPLFKYLDKDKYKKLYVMPDLSLTYISMNYMRYKNYWFIQLFDSIENIIDFNNIVSKSSYDHGDKIMAHFVNKQDKSISKIYNMIKSQQDVEIQESDDLHIQINQPIKSWILVGHGISEVRGFNYIGAKSIKKTKKININLDEYLSIKSKIKNVLVISCSSGTLINDYAERNNGVWASLLEKNISYILYCKWDVSIEYTNRLLEIILNKMRDSKNILLSEALVSAQKEMCSYHPILWAGLEVWKNE